jgi:hypothetical protein
MLSLYHNPCCWVRPKSCSGPGVVEGRRYLRFYLTACSAHGHGDQFFKSTFRGHRRSALLGNYVSWCQGEYVSGGY